MVEQIAEATTGKEMNFTYGNNNQRLKVDYLLNSQNQYTRYYAENYDKQISTTETKQWNYIYTPSGLSAVYYVNNGTGQLLYTLTDHLGSPVLLSNTAGQVVEEYSFDAWGRRRNPQTWTALPPSGGTGGVLIRGYTFHEHLDEFNLINMNARLYDPLVSRMLSADNEVTDPGFTQSYNRYSYVINNPLKYVDPSGNDWYVADGSDTPEWFEGYTKKDIVAGYTWLSDNKNVINLEPVTVTADRITTPNLNVSNTELLNNNNNVGEQSSVNSTWQYSIPGLGPSQQTVDELRAGNYVAAFSALAFTAIDVFTWGQGTVERNIITTAAKGGQNVYRAVDVAELAVIKSTGKFSLQAGGVEAKYFAKSKTAALVFGEKIYGSGGLYSYQGHSIWF